MKLNSKHKDNSRYLIVVFILLVVQFGLVIILLNMSLFESSSNNLYLLPNIFNIMNVKNIYIYTLNNLY